MNIFLVNPLKAQQLSHNVTTTDQHILTTGICYTT